MPSAAGHRLVVAASLAFLSGWADVICLVRFSAFAGMQTGNAVWLGRDVAEGRPIYAVFHLTIICSNMLGVMMYELSARTNASLRLVAVLVGCATVSADLLDALVGSSRWSVCFVAAAFGAQNALTANDARLSVNTTIMTGNVAKIGAALTQMLLRREMPAKQALSSRMSGAPPCSFPTQSLRRRPSGLADRSRLHSAPVAAAVLMSTIVGAIVGAGSLRVAPGGDWCFSPVGLLQVGVLARYPLSLRPPSLWLPSPRLTAEPAGRRPPRSARTSCTILRLRRRASRHEQ